MMQRLAQIRQRSGAPSQSTHLQQSTTHANMLTNTSHSLGTHALGLKRPMQSHRSEQHAQLPSGRSLQPQLSQSHAVNSQSAPERGANQSNGFDFDSLGFGCPSPQYPFASQAPSSSSSTPPLPFSSSLFTSVPLNSSMSDSSSSSSHFTPSSSEQSHLMLPNGHCSMDALDARETLDHMIHGGPSDHRQSVIQFRSVDWDAT